MNCRPTCQLFFNQRIVPCIMFFPYTTLFRSFPSLRRFLTLAPACWSRGKIPPHPSARSAHSSPQNGGPKGDRKSRRLNSSHGKRTYAVSHLTTELQQPDRTLYRVPTLDPRRP